MIVLSQPIDYIFVVLFVYFVSYICSIIDSDGKKVGGHVATPYPAKQAGKTPGNKPNQQTPQSGGSVTCKSCPKTFGSDKALESHTKAKHSNK